MGPSEVFKRQFFALFASSIYDGPERCWGTKEFHDIVNSFLCSPQIIPKELFLENL